MVLRVLGLLRNSRLKSCARLDEVFLLHIGLTDRQIGDGIVWLERDERLSCFYCLVQVTGLHMEADQRQMSFRQVWGELDRLTEGYFSGWQIVIRQQGQA